MTKKQLLITFDYELFLGNKSGSIENCMIEPTNAIMQSLRPFNAHAVFFVDTTYLLRLKDQSKTTEACKKDFETISIQLINLVKEGHYVFPHIHPHWLDAEYLQNTNEWRLNNVSKYRFHNISVAERLKVFDGSIQLLKDILNPSFPDYKIDGYRAGGWGIQPFEDFLPFFQKHQIKYEFSVLGGMYQFTDAQNFDFSNSPEKFIYRFSDDVCKEDVNGPFIQYRMNTIRISETLHYFNRIWIKLLLHVFRERTTKKGEGQPSKAVKGKIPASSSGKDLSTTYWERISIELLTRIKLPAYRKFFENNNYMHFISHPKMITDHNLEVFNNFLSESFEKYSIETNFYTMQPE